MSNGHKTNNNNEGTTETGNNNLNAHLNVKEHKKYTIYNIKIKCTECRMPVRNFLPCQFFVQNKLILFWVKDLKDSRHE